MGKHKYNVSPAKARTCDGICFDSKKEMEFYKKLKIRQAAHEIAYFLRQVPFDLPGNTKYKCDFVVFTQLGGGMGVEYVDVKGMRTAMYKLKKKQVEALYPVTIQEV